MRSRFQLARASLLALSTVAAMGASHCGSASPVEATLSQMDLRLNKADLEGVSSLLVDVYEGDGLSCSDSGLLAGPTRDPIVRKTLSNTGCEGAARFCGSLVVGTSAVQRYFVGSGLSSTNEKISVGCAVAVVNQATAVVDLAMKRFTEPAVCGNKRLELREQCEKDDLSLDPNCESKCQSSEIFISKGADRLDETMTGADGEKADAVFAWASSPEKLNGKWVAFFTDRTNAPGDINVAVRSAWFGTYPDQGETLAQSTMFLPNNPNRAIPPLAAPGRQSSPSVALIDGRYYVAFEDDSRGNTDIFLRSFDPFLTAEQSTPIGINGAGGNGEVGSQTKPVVSANANGILIVAWENGGELFHRTLDPKTLTLGAVQKLSTLGVTNRGTSVASVGASWVATWASGNNVFMRSIGQDGTPLDAVERGVNELKTGAIDRAAVAGHGDGRFAVAWTDRASKDVWFQRFGSDTTAFSGDQTNPVNDKSDGVDGDQMDATIASIPSGNGGYVLAWSSDLESIHARFFDRNGLPLVNNVNGRGTHFVVETQTDVFGGRRVKPAIAVGGAGPYLVIGWESAANDFGPAGIHARRFPLP
ncbi:MAG: hypothetical protein KBF88_02435 [Polyangiaceae bacterium]|nr:hypothetical protein [Polyangiaceae bacterium]